MKQDCKVALCQLRPTLGDLERNFAMHHEWLDRALEDGAELAVFPELSLTGYFLRDLTQDIALPISDERVQKLIARSKECSIVFGMVEESDDHLFFNSVLFAEDGELLHCHRKVHLPDYGIFEEGRYFAAGDDFGVVNSKFGCFGLLVCEDAWHFSSAWLQSLQGVDAFIIPSVSPARGIDNNQSESSSKSSWQSLNSTTANMLQAWVLHCNRVGFEDGAIYWGSSSVHSPFGNCVAQAKGEDEDLLIHQIGGEEIRRARMFTPLRRDEKPDLVRRKLAQLLNDPDAL